MITYCYIVYIYLHYKSYTPQGCVLRHGQKFSFHNYRLMNQWLHFCIYWARTTNPQEKGVPAVRIILFRESNKNFLGV